jgi:hypothetical protein
MNDNAKTRIAFVDRKEEDVHFSLRAATLPEILYST